MGGERAGMGERWGQEVARTASFEQSLALYAQTLRKFNHYSHLTRLYLNKQKMAESLGRMFALTQKAQESQEAAAQLAQKLALTHHNILSEFESFKRSREQALLANINTIFHTELSFAQQTKNFWHNLQ